MVDKVKFIRWPRLDIFDGSAEALIAASLVSREQLPGQPGVPLDEAIYCRGELVTTPKRFRFDGRTDSADWMRVNRLGPDLYRVARGIPPEERARRGEEKARERSEARERYEREKLAQRRPAAPPTTAAEFRREIVQLVQTMAVAVLSHVQGHETRVTTYEHRFSSDTFEELSEQFGRVIETLEGADVSTMATGLTAARADPRFQQFLAAQCITIADD